MGGAPKFCFYCEYAAEKDFVLIKFLPEQGIHFFSGTSNRVHDF